MLKTTWPQSATILDMGFSDKGNVDLESVIARQPDLMIAQLRAEASADGERRHRQAQRPARSGAVCRL